MTIKQLSVFLENKTGRINEVTKILGKNGINMHAFSMAETTDFGILKACKLMPFLPKILVTSLILPVLFSRKTDNCLIVISYLFMIYDF